MNDLIAMLQTSADRTPEQTEALRVDNDLRIHKSMVVNGLVAMAYDLKQIRDRKMFAALGYETFEAYTESEHGIKSRQAYKYIHAYEQLGKEQLELSAGLGITKLDMLASLDKDEREQVLAENTVEELDAKSTSEYKELLAKYQQVVEQLSFLEKEPEKKEDEFSDKVVKTIRAETRKQVEQEFAEKQAKLIADKEKAYSDYKELKAKLKTALDEKKAVEEARDNAVKARVKAEANAAQASDLSDKLKAEKERLAAMEKQIKMSANPELTKFKYMFEDWQAKTQALVAQFQKLDSETATKMRGAVKKVLEVNGL